MKPQNLPLFTLRIVPGLVLVLALAACASVSVKPGTEYATPQMPKQIFVTQFVTAGGTFAVDREGAELATFKQDLQVGLQTGMVTDLSKRLIFAAPTAKQKGFKPIDAWLIRGQFTLVNQGSRALRGAIGFGAGGTKMETQVQVYDLNQPNSLPFLTFATTGGSGAEPGAITAIATDPLQLVIQAAASSGGGIAHGVTEDTARTAREITAVLSDYMYRSGWITKDKWIQPKQYSN